MGRAARRAEILGNETTLGGGVCTGVGSGFGTLSGWTFLLKAFEDFVLSDLAFLLAARVAVDLLGFDARSLLRLLRELSITHLAYFELPFFWTFALM